MNFLATINGIIAKTTLTVRNLEEENELIQENLRKMKRTDRKKKIEEAQENFSKFFEFAIGKVDEVNFSIAKQNLLGKLKQRSKNIPNFSYGATLHEEFCSKLTLFYI
jgi:hypothetical protein